MFQHSRNKSKKKGALIGQQCIVPRKGEKGVQTYLYRPKDPGAGEMPVLFNVHGGAWIGSDATALDSQSQMLSDRFSCFVVNVNYTKLDAKPFPYPQYELRDTVLYFRDHAKEYHIDPERFSLIGYSAGGHLCAGTAMLLRDAGFRLNSQFLCYPFLDFNMLGDLLGADGEKTAKLMGEIFFTKMEKSEPLLSPAAAPAEALQKLAPAEIITCGEDALYAHAVNYRQLLTRAGVSTVQKDFPGSIHGFLEVNFPETQENGAKSAEQEALMQQAMEYICDRARYHWQKEK